MTDLSGYSRQELIYLCKHVMESAERFEDMFQSMLLVISGEEQLSLEEIGLLDVAGKQSISPLSIALKRFEENRIPTSQDHPRTPSDYHQRLTEEFRQVFYQGAEALQTLLKKYEWETQPQEVVACLEIQGRWNKRYLDHSDNEEALLEKTKMLYDDAALLAQERLEVDSSLCIKLEAFRSVFYRENLGDRNAAIEIGTAAFDRFITSLEMNVDRCSWSYLYAGLLRDNLTLWSSEVPSDRDD